MKMEQSNQIELYSDGYIGPGIEGIIWGLLGMVTACPPIFVICEKKNIIFFRNID